MSPECCRADIQDARSQSATCLELTNWWHWPTSPETGRKQSKADHLIHVYIFSMFQVTAAWTSSAACSSTAARSPTSSANGSSSSRTTACDPATSRGSSGYRTDACPRYSLGKRLLTFTYRKLKSYFSKSAALCVSDRKCEMLWTYLV